ncbi:ATP-binding cassette domain-containing protein [Rhizobium leucaenae]|uniref:ATP-binding cassette domain-containing protein n=1 Tax=Rhizobium leucaenae TaxID=29450 RepID=UPI00155F9B86|nr:ATP-binding cassette domain-containing protein [Rhizobium leucaenae]MBB6303786.1 ABC-type transport system involved in cytochrome bd biosynthesis fused ATPase/permease subunit [Rhizobium leucaenae]
MAGLTTAAATFNFHIPAAFIRLFAIGRTAARYGERLIGHKAALADQAHRRVDLFASMAAAPAVRQAGWQLGDEARLADYLDDVEDVDYARLRARLPLLTITIGLAALLGCSAVIAPLAMLPIVSVLLAGTVAAHRLQKIGVVAWTQARLQRRNGAEQLGAAMASAVSLRAERLWDEECRSAMNALSESDRRVHALRRLQSEFDALASLAGPIAGISVVAGAWLGGDRGEAMLLPIALGFAWLALGEAINGASRILVANLRREAAWTEISQWKRDADAPAACPENDTLRELRHQRLQRISPSGVPIGHTPITLCLRPGFPTILVGASGSGKSSLLKQIAGWIGEEDAFDTSETKLSARQRRALTTLVLHDAAVLDDTVRGNLFDPAGSDIMMWRALAAVELDERIRNAGGLDAWIRQDMLSLGEAQRLNLARVFLAQKPIVLLDEPIEHLDTAQGERILSRLANHLSNRIVVISSHHPIRLRDSIILNCEHNICSPSQSNR